jgi:hypothetical protein
MELWTDSCQPRNFIEAAVNAKKKIPAEAYKACSRNTE